MKHRDYVYTICRIDSKLWKYINTELQERGYTDLKCFVPTVQLLEKTKNKKDIFREIPLLFNYGFIRMSSQLAYDRNFLFKLKREIPGIISFLKSLDNLHPKKLRRRIDNAEDFDDFSKVATVTKEQFKHYMHLSRINRLYSLAEISVKVGDFIVLKKYPFEGLTAKVIDFNYVNQTVLVDIYLSQGSILSLQVPFDNVIYSVYDNFDEDDLILDEASRVDINLLGEEDEPTYDEDIIKLK